MSFNSKNYRAIPDISLIANPMTGVKIVYNNNWYTIGGTSLSCHIFAGILSVANQQRFNLGKNPLTTVYTQTPTSNNPPSSIPKSLVQNCLYKTIYENTNYRKNCLKDIVFGDDGNFSAGDGYDVASGLGSPNTYYICNALNYNID